MASHGIRDQVAIVGMGCTNFGEHWDQSTDDLLIDVVVGGARRRPASRSTTSTRSGSARWAPGLSGPDAQPPAEDRPQAGHPRRELLRHRVARRSATPATPWPRGAYDVAMAIGVEKLKDSGYSGLVVVGPGQRRHAADGHRAGVVQPARPGLRQEVRRRPRRDEGRPHPHRVEEPPQRRAQPAGAVPQGGRRRRRSRAARSSPGRSASSTARACQRRLGGGDHRARRGRPPVHRPPAVREGAVVHRRAGRRADRPDATTTRRFAEVVRSRRGRLRAGRHHRPARRAGDGRGARLLHADRAGADGGPRVRRARHGLEGGARRDVRPRRRAAGQPRRRPQVVRPPDRRVRAADAVRVLDCSCAARPATARSPVHRARQAQGAHPQPRRQPRRLRQLRLRRRRRARLRRIVEAMCRNITELRGLQPPATAQEIEAAARQYVRKVSGLGKVPASVTEDFERAVAEVTETTTTRLLRLAARTAPAAAGAVPPLRRPEVRARIAARQAAAS